MSPRKSAGSQPPEPAATQRIQAVVPEMAAESRLLQELRQATLGEYEILAELGRGGMATVFLAHDVALDRKVAIKVMSPALLDGEGSVERFKREARTAGALSHPHIIPIHAVKESGELLYFVMKFVEGRSLDSVIRTEGPLSIDLVVQVLVEVSGALAYAHRKGVVHRDIKPANIMLDDGGWAVVTDFGIAKVERKEGLTMTGTTVGTPAYMSPEQCLATDVTGRSDQYSLGIVAYELLTGRQPFTAESLMGMFLAHMDETAKPLAELRPDCPPLLASVVERMMAKKPEQRWPAMDDVITALGPLQQNVTREQTRTSLMALARVSDGRPKAHEFTRPLSPTPLNRPSQAQAPSPAIAAAARRGLMPLWAWGAIATPILGVVAWLAFALGRGGVQSGTRDSAARQPTASDSASVVSAGTPSRSPTSPPQSSDSSRVNGAQPPLGSGSSPAAPRPEPQRIQTPREPAQRGVTQQLPGGTTTAAVADSARNQTRTETQPQPVPAAAGANVAADTTPRVIPALADAPTFTAISAGGSTTCGALANEGGVLCWGAPALDGNLVQGLLFEKISVGDGHICGLTPSGEAYCWGSNNSGQLGDGSNTERPGPTPVRAPQRFTEIAVGSSHTCALTADGAAFCWGANRYGQLGDGSRTARNRPVLVRTTEGNRGFQSLAVGGAHTCGITRANKAFCWGDGFSGQVGNAMQDYAQEPFAVKTELSFRSVVTGDRHTCGLTTSGRAYCWGSNKDGQLGNETRDDRSVPDSVYTNEIFVSLAAGGSHNCGLSNRRQLFCWGQNVDGRLGDGTRSIRTTPVVAAGGQAFARVSAGSGHTCALLAGGQAMCWGGNARGQLGGGSTSQFSASPVIVKVRG